jgi:excisionase family DNA binding protein
MNKEQILLSPISLDELETRLVSRLKSELNTIQTVPTNPQEDDFLTAKQTSKLLGVSIVSLHKWKKSGLIKYHRFGSRIRFRKSEILQTKKYDRRAGK